MALSELTWMNENTLSQKILVKSNTPNQHDDAQRGPRQRKTHKKARTGCLTCKIRRKKCDETKPTCQRCSNARVKCDGYASVPSTTLSSPKPSKPDSGSGHTTPDCASLTSSTSASSPAEETWRPTTTDIHIPTKSMASHNISRTLKFFADVPELSDIDQHCFAYFRHRTAPQFASYFETSLWRSGTIRGLGHPALFWAAAALGAVHRRFSYGISPEAFEYCGHAARLHALATRQLHDLKLQCDDGALQVERESLMMTEVVLGMYQMFQDEPEMSKAHLDAALEHFIRGRKLKFIHTESRYCFAKSNPRVFCRLMHRLHCRAAEIFDSPIKTIPRKADDKSLPHIPCLFSSLEEARDCLFTEIDWILHTPALWQTMKIRNQTQDEHFDRLMTWDRAYTKMIRNMTRTPQQRKARILIRLARNTAYLLLYLTFFTNIDTRVPNLLPTLEDDSDDEENDGLARATKILWEAARRKETLSTNLARIKTMVEAMLDDTGIWDADTSIHTSLPPQTYQEDIPEIGMYAVAERIHAGGETAVLRAIREVLPDHIDTSCIDVTCTIEQRRLLLRYYVPDPAGLGVWWTQEWWEL